MREIQKVSLPWIEYANFISYWNCNL